MEKPKTKSKWHITSFILYPTDRVNGQLVIIWHGFEDIGPSLTPFSPSRVKLFSKRFGRHQSIVGRILVFCVCKTVNAWKFAFLHWKSIIGEGGLEGRPTQTSLSSRKIPIKSRIRTIPSGLHWFLKQCPNSIVIEAEGCHFSCDLLLHIQASDKKDTTTMSLSKLHVNPSWCTQVHRRGDYLHYKFNVKDYIINYMPHNVRSQMHVKNERFFSINIPKWSWISRYHWEYHVHCNVLYCSNSVVVSFKWWE